MEEERLLILRMVQDGKITAEEAAALLDALQAQSSTSGAAFTESGYTGSDSSTAGDKTADAKAGTDWEKQVSDMADKASQKISEKLKKLNDPEVSRKIEEEASKFAENVQRAAEQFGRLLEERIQKDIKPALANIPSFLENLPFIGNLMSGLTVTEEEEYSGELTGDEVEIHYTGRNGILEVKPWDSYGYRLEVRKTMKGSRPEELKSVKAFDVVSEPERLEFRVKPDLVAGVKGTLWLPRNKSYSLHLDTSNGAIRIQGLKGKDFNLSTSNARVELRNLTGQQVRAKTSNGTIECTDVVCNDVELETSNGTIIASVDAQSSRYFTSNGVINVKLKTTLERLSGEGNHVATTSNGSIEVALAESILDYARVDARTNFGNIKIKPEELAVKVDGENIGNRHIVAEGSKYESADNRLNLVVKTTNAGITIKQLGE